MLAWEELKDTLTEKANKPDETKLCRTMRPDEDPDEAVNAIAYTKGANFFRTLERTRGRQRFDAFMRNYFDTHAFQPMTCEEFVRLVKQDLFVNDDAAIAEAHVDDWALGHGLARQR